VVEAGRQRHCGACGGEEVDSFGRMDEGSGLPSPVEGLPVPSPPPTTLCAPAAARREPAAAGVCGGGRRRPCGDCGEVGVDSYGRMGEGNSLPSPVGGRAAEHGWEGVGGSGPPPEEE